MLFVCQFWEESERGWGVRPDGFSLHLSMADHAAYVKEHNDALPKGYVPDEYTRVSGSAHPIDLPAGVVRKIKGHGTWFSGTPETLMGEKEAKPMIVVPTNQRREIGEKCEIYADAQANPLVEPQPGVVMGEATLADYQAQEEIPESVRNAASVRRKYFYFVSTD